MRFHVVLLAVWFVLLSPVVNAMQWATGFEQPGVTLIKREHIDRFIKDFQLDDDRATIARSLYDLYVGELATINRESIEPIRIEWVELVKAAQTERRKLSNEMNEAIKAAFDSGADSREVALIAIRFEDALAELDARPIEGEIKLARLADEQAAIEAAFLNNLRALLSKSEQDSWPTYRRWLDRTCFLARDAAYPEIGINLLAHVEGAELSSESTPSPEAFDAVCRAYELAIDGELRSLREWQTNFNRRHHRRQQELNQALRQVEVLDDNGQFRGVRAVDPVAAQSFFEFSQKGLVLRQAIRDTNREFRARLLSLLHAEAAATLRNSFNDELHVAYWRPEKSKSYLLMRELDAKQVVSDEQRAVMQLWLDQLDEARTRNADEHLALSNERLDSMAEGVMGPGVLDQFFQRWRALQREALSLDNACLERLWTQLTPEQQAQVDKPGPWPLPPGSSSRSGQSNPTGKRMHARSTSLAR